jgi:hypothetical protein
MSRAPAGLLTIRGRTIREHGRDPDECDAVILVLVAVGLQVILQPVGGQLESLGISWIEVTVYPGIIS